MHAMLDRYRTHFDCEKKVPWEADSSTNVFPGLAEKHPNGALLEPAYHHGRTYEMGDAWGHSPSGPRTSGTAERR